MIGINFVVGKIVFDLQLLRHKNIVDAEHIEKTVIGAGYAAAFLDETILHAPGYPAVCIRHGRIIHIAANHC